MPFFSIIIPTYNRANMLPVALQSVLNQTFQDWECIIVDDGSTDNTKNIVAEWTEKDSRFKYIYQENAERSAARNNGINHAKGEYICFLDSDDYYLKNKLDDLNRFILRNKNPNALIISSLSIQIEGSIKTIELPDFGNSNYFDFFAQNTVFSQQICTSKQIVIQIQYNNRFNIGEDFELWLRIADNYDIIQFKEEIGTVICDHADRSVNLKNHNSPKEQRKTLRYCFKKNHPGSRISTNLKRKLLADSYFNSAKHFMFNNKKSEAMINIIFSLLINLRNTQFKHRLSSLVYLLTYRIPLEYTIKN